jgi:hypothetical protein
VDVELRKSDTSAFAIGIFQQRIVEHEAATTTENSPQKKTLPFHLMDFMKVLSTAQFARGSHHACSGHWIRLMRPQDCSASGDDFVARDRVQHFVPARARVLPAICLPEYDVAIPKRSGQFRVTCAEQRNNAGASGCRKVHRACIIAYEDGTPFSERSDLPQSRLPRRVKRRVSHRAFDAFAVLRIARTAE